VARAHFGPELFRFLRDLAKHNDREWFAKHKARYEEHARDPMLRFIADLAPRLRRISPRFVADPRPVGGSLFRIHRDTRFSKDKSPYKTAVAASFRHEAGKLVPAPGFYLHLEPGDVMSGAGLWHPDRDALAKVRDAIVAKPERFERAVSGKAMAKLAWHGESLKRPPPGYPPDHPLVEHLKRKDFAVGATWDEKRACAPDFLERCVESYRTAAPLMEWLTRALGLPW
jgi:uncharacterized protein (TIGR02453 family)